jgi:hypothetical protein
MTGMFNVRTLIDYLELYARSNLCLYITLHGTNKMYIGETPSEVWEEASPSVFEYWLRTYGCFNIGLAINRACDVLAVHFLDWLDIKDWIKELDTGLLETIKAKAVFVKGKMFEVYLLLKPDEPFSIPSQRKKGIHHSTLLKHGDGVLLPPSFTIEDYIKGYKLSTKYTFWVLNENNIFTEGTEEILGRQRLLEEIPAEDVKTILKTLWLR